MPDDLVTLVYLRTVFLTEQNLFNKLEQRFSLLWKSHRGVTSGTSATEVVQQFIKPSVFIGLRGAVFLDPGWISFLFPANAQTLKKSQARLDANPLSL